MEGIGRKVKKRERRTKGKERHDSKLKGRK